jgi:hypothetical protein
MTHDDGARCHEDASVWSAAMSWLAVALTCGVALDAA